MRQCLSTFLSIESKILTEVNPANIFVLGQLLGSSGTENLPIIHYIGSIGDLQGFSDILIRHEDTDTLGFEMSNDSLDVLKTMPSVVWW